MLGRVGRSSIRISAALDGRIPNSITDAARYGRRRLRATPPTDAICGDSVREDSAR
jgi:hypothetical protein